MIDAFDWAAFVIHRLVRTRRNIRINGLTIAICQDLEMWLQKLCRFEHST
ncbi:MAG: hypothetical protein MK102_07215 [Fuerstiella sp.]|nr:hypothetical protein [Fuerstiella sp.]